MNYSSKHLFTTGELASQVKRWAHWALQRATASSALPVGPKTNVQQMKPRLHLPSPLVGPGPHPCTQLSDSLQSLSDHPRRQEELCATQHWTCQLGLLRRASSWNGEARGSYTAYLPVFLNWVWEGEGREIMQQVQRKFFFVLNCLKRQNDWDVRKRYDIKEKRETWLLVQNLVLNFHPDLIRQAPTGISGYLLNQEWSSRIRNCRLGIL